MVAFRAEQKYSQNIQSKCYYVCHKSHIDCLSIAPRLPGGEEAQLPPKVWPRHTKIKKGNISAMVVRREVIHSELLWTQSSGM
jgi:hypothetical protein